MIIKMNKKELTKFSNFWLLQGAQLCCEHEAEIYIKRNIFWTISESSLIVNPC